MITIIIVLALMFFEYLMASSYFSSINIISDKLDKIMEDLDRLQESNQILKDLMINPKKD